MDACTPAMLDVRQLLLTVAKVTTRHIRRQRSQLHLSRHYIRRGTVLQSQSRVMFSHSASGYLDHSLSLLVL